MRADLVSQASNQTSRDFPIDVGFHHIFGSIVRTRPHAIAISDGDRHLNYADLDWRSSQLAGYLVERGVALGARVSIFMNRSVDLVVAMLAVAKAGGAYVPLDPAYPEQRLRDMLADSGTLLILTHGVLEETATALAGGRCECIVIDAQWSRIRMSPAQPTTQALVDGQLAYVIYTSGSTGQPKGVMINHAALTNFLLSMAEMPGMADDDVLLAVTTHCFDISGLELLLPLVSGGRCWLCPTQTAADAHRLMALIGQVKPTMMQATPATWMMLFQAGWSNAEQVRILCGGEPLSDTLKNFFAQTRSEIWNMYGPTETTIWSTVDKLDFAQPVSIGRPIANTRIYIMREDQSLCGIDEPGELCIAGAGLAEGYLNKPALTAEKFIANPFEPGGRLYRTGDLACWRAWGVITHLGRIDNQVKIRGYRVETGEIEARLDAYPGIRQSVVVVKENAGGGQLVAYWVPADSARPSGWSGEALRIYLSEHLPGYMVPAFFIELEQIPLTPSGKLDRKELSRRPVSASNSVQSADSGEVVQYIISEWHWLLGVDNIRADSRFVAIGGDSITANMFITNLNRTFGCELTVASLSHDETPSKIAQLVLTPSLLAVAESAGGTARTRDTGSVHGADRHAPPKAARTDRESMMEHAGQGGARGVERHDIAIVGMAGKFPLADTVEAFWDHVVNGRNCISAAALARPALLGDNGGAAQDATDLAAAWGGFMLGVFDFDPAFFRISPREAELMDPQQRLMLTCVWHALEDAGIAPEVFRRRRSGVFVAASQNNYAVDAAKRAGNKGYLVTGHATSMIPNRISFLLDLFGPSECVETTCSSSLVALHRAVRAIRYRECEQAIVGGINLLISPDYFESYHAMGLLSSDQATRTFQSEASGYVRSEALGMVILKPLEQAIEDNDTIHAVIKGTSVNHGGSAASLTVPNKQGIAAAIRDAIIDSGIAAETIGYIEAHGTGSLAGDDIEVDALRSALEPLVGDGWTHQDCMLSGLKPSIGHSEVASGMAALIKVVSAIRYGVIPGTPGIREQDVAARWPGIPFRLSSANHTWQSARDPDGKPLPRRAGINSYGFGVNAHVIVEEYQQADGAARDLPVAASGGAPYVAVFSARTPHELALVLQDMQAFLGRNPNCNFADLIHTLQVGRQALEVRLAIVAATVFELTSKLEQATRMLAAAEPNASSVAHSLGDVFYSGVPLGEAGSHGSYAVADLDANPAALAKAWTSGGRVRWAGIGGIYRRLPLPKYPFQHKEYCAGRSVTNTARRKRICVVGAGPGGLVMAKSLLEENHEPIVYESQQSLGGVWNLSRDKVVGTYSTTRFQNSKDTSFFSDFYPGDMEDMFPSVHDVRSYLEAYADRFDLKRHIHCGSRVTSVREVGQRWQVEIETGDQRRIEEFDGVALCHGRYQIPRRLEIEGLDTLKGQLLHAGQYFDNSPFVGKRVLVIGSGVSGMDIATEASKVADAVYWSIRSRKFILPRMVGFLPNDFVSPVNLLLDQRLRGQRYLDRLELSVPVFNEAFERSGLRPSLDELLRHPFIHINDEVVELVAAGRIKTVFGQVDRFDGNACFHRGDDVAIEDIDVVVECSGYRTDALWHYLEGVDAQRDFAMGLFYRSNPMLVNQYGLQEIGVVGTFPYLEMAARWYAQIVSGNYTLSAEELALAADTRQIVMGPLASIVIGMKLGLVPDPCVQFKEFWALLNTPSFPAQFRLRGRHANPDAPMIVDTCRQRSFVHGEAQDPEIRRLKFRLLAGLGVETLRQLLRQQQITELEYAEALKHLAEPLIIDWQSQFLTPYSDEIGAQDTQSAPGDSLMDDNHGEYLRLIKMLKERTMDGDDFLLELKALSRVL
ncbi:amino acid adenylation domain-containing protein [Mycoavidus sp. HKI]|uniref:amino acid adenylation domain-containing protein n=1 Tax=Mycoavidus sp. HKI TaxID=2840467 RepID=UPI001CBE1C07|nr:amino acid adenylation domain-containing protein [Mycoavidus sp. HKI]UAW64149.1 amino acid adenylation domain-containing protein [Mycoavidus sp. HKI]